MGGLTGFSIGHGNGGLEFHMKGHESTLDYYEGFFILVMFEWEPKESRY